MKNLSLFVMFFAALGCASNESKSEASKSANTESMYAIHRAIPDHTVYIPENQYEKILKTMPPPPKAGSKEQAADEKTLLNYQKTRTAEDCKRANSEVQFDFANYF